MGVKGLSVQLRKHASAIATPYASLSELHGRSLAIDANLLLQKIHYVTFREDGVDPHRHTKAWYTFLKALEREEIKPFIVFDGQTRLPAKSGEHRRRQEARRLESKRARAEQVRGERLAALRTAFASLGGDQRAAAMLKAARTRIDALALEDELSQMSELDKSPLVEQEKGSNDVFQDEAAAPTDEQQHVEPPQAKAIPRASHPNAQAAAGGPQPRSIVASIAGWALRSIDSIAGLLTSSPSTEAPKPAAVATRRDDEEALAHESDERADAKVEEAVEEVLRIRKELLEDANTAVYSKRQRSVSDQERAFFSSVFTGEEISRSESDHLEAIRASSDEIETSLKKRTTPVPSHAYREVVELVEAMGLPFLQPSPESPHEAEGICSTLYSLGLVDYVVSEDTDVLVYGAPLLRRITTRRQPAPVWRSGGHASVITDDEDEDEDAVELGEALLGKIQPGTMNVVDPGKLLGALGLTREQFVDFALLCGTDFTERIPKLGPVTALKLIKEHGTIEAVFANETRFQPTSDREAYMRSINVARQIFLSLPPIPENARLEAREPAADLPDILAKFGISYSSS